MTKRAKQRKRVARAIWCDRSMIRCQFVGLCVDVEQFRLELLRLEIAPQEWPPFVSPGAAATVHSFDNEKRGRLAIVCITPDKNSTLVEHYGLLVHEAVHLWQSELRYMRETNPGDEIEAYSIQNIAQQLMVSFKKLTGGRHGTASRTRARRKE